MTLRELRLWHYRRGLVLRASQTSYEAEMGGRSLLNPTRKYYAYQAQKAKDGADFHFAAVFSLDGYFSVDDTVEKDAEKERT